MIRLVEHLFDMGMDGARYRAGQDSSDEDRSAREREMWVRRLEEADGIRRPGVEHAGRRSTSNNADPTISATATTSLLSAPSLISSPAPPRQSTPPLPPLPTENDQRVQRDVQEARDVVTTVQPETPVRRSTRASPMKRSYSSPAQRSDAPSPSQRGSDGVPLLSEADLSGVSDRLPAASDSAVDPDRAKRRRVKGPEGHVGPALGHRATLPTILPSFPRPIPVDAALTRSSSDPTTFAVWTLVPPPPGGPQRTPCHASLDRSNYVETPWEVLRAAGHAVRTDSDASKSLAPPTSSSSSRRLGYIFVAEECEREFLIHLRKGLEQESGRTVLKPVLVLTMTAFHRGFSFASARVQHLILASV